MSWKSKPSWYHAKCEAQTSAEFVRAHSAIVNALTATIMNAEAGLNWLSAQPPDLDEVRRALNYIANDGKRAGEVVVRLRAPMKGSPIADDPIDP
jgi:hypothetical protein